MTRMYGRNKRWAERIKDYKTYLDITEKDNVEGSIGFKMPFLPPGSFDLSGTASLHKMRRGNRTFQTGENFSALLTKDYYDFCMGDANQVASNSIPVGPIPRDKNILYPITGSIGLRKVVNTFLAIASQGGAGGNFIDDLSFTTEAMGSINPSVTISPVTNAFRLVNAGTTVLASSIDLHTVKISLAFPTIGPGALAQGADAASAAKVEPKAGK